MAQGKSPRNPLAFASVLYPGRCLAVELAISWAYWKPPKGNPPGPRTLIDTVSPFQAFSALALPVILLRLCHFLLVVRPWWFFAPFTRFGRPAVTFLHALALVEPAAQVELRIGMPLLGRLLGPLCCLGVALLNTLTVSVNNN